MTTQQQAHGGSDFRLEVRRTFAASRAKVFAAWTEPALLAKWMCLSHPGSKSEYLELDVRPGGHYRMKNTAPSGETCLLSGTYREIRPPERLVFTWQWEWEKSAGEKGAAMTADGETLVTVEFLAHGDSTEVVLTHEGFASAEVRAQHSSGWNGCFDTLSRVLGI